MKKRLLIGLGMALVFVFVVRTIHVRAQGDEFEVLYLSETQPKGDGIIFLFKVDLDPTGIANLKYLPDAGYGPGKIPFDRAHIACTPDGKKLYAVDFVTDENYSDPTLGYLEVDTASWHEIDTVKIDSITVLIGMGQAAFSPDGKLYVSSNSTDSLYTVDTGTAEATLIGKLNINVQGGDLAFAADGTLYFWNNYPPKGLYVVTLPPDPVHAFFLGPSSVTFNNLSGLAIRENGYGNLVGSVYGGKIYVIDKTNGSYGGTLPTFQMKLDGTDFPYQYGDMTVGPLVLCTRTIGYWKNHSWEDATVTINGETIDELLGRSSPKGEKPGNGILWLARGNNFSMLYAQLIAAKLNCGDCVGITIIDEAEDFLLNEMVFLGDFNQEFVSKTQKKEATKLAEALDAFNNQYPCEED